MEMTQLIPELFRCQDRIVSSKIEENRALFLKSKFDTGLELVRKTLDNRCFKKKEGDTIIYKWKNIATFIKCLYLLPQMPLLPNLCSNFLFKKNKNC